MIEDDGWLYLEPSDVVEVGAQWGIDVVQVSGKLEAACSRPRRSVGGEDVYRDVAGKAGALAFAITGVYHPFVDGNKRAGALATLQFCYVNGYDPVLAPGELLAVIVQIARGLMTEIEVIEFLRSRMNLTGDGPQ